MPSGAGAWCRQAERSVTSEKSSNRNNPYTRGNASLTRVLDRINTVESQRKIVFKASFQEVILAAWPCRPVSQPRRDDKLSMPCGISSVGHRKPSWWEDEIYRNKETVWGDCGGKRPSYISASARSPDRRELAAPRQSTAVTWRDRAT